MIALILTLTAIALLAVMLFSGISYFPADVGETQRIQAEATSGFGKLGAAFLGYRIANERAPATSTWETDLTPTYTRMPKTPTGLSWSYGTDGNGGYWFCLSGDLTKSRWDGLNRLANTYSDGAYFLNSGCGAKADGSAPGVFPAAGAATYWVIGPLT